MRSSVLKAVGTTRYLILLITILMLVSLITSCAADNGNIEDYVSLVDNLRKAGAVVEPGGQVGPDLLSAKRMVMTVNDSNVTVWEYDDSAAADAEATYISPDGFSIRTDTKGICIGWVAQPHFYKAGKLIVLYVGESEAVTNVLESVLGQQFAGQ